MTRLRRPRWLYRLHARMFGLFWLPCQVCGRRFSGHEWNLDKHTGYPEAGPPGHGVAVCSAECAHAMNGDPPFPLPEGARWIPMRGVTHTSGSRLAAGVILTDHEPLAFCGARGPLVENDVPNGWRSTLVCQREPHQKGRHHAQSQFSGVVIEWDDLDG